MEVKELHPLVELVLARMESHPEEFSRGPVTSEHGDRWWRVRETIETCGTEEEQTAFRAAARKIVMNAGHEWMMDELLNGEERRREERRREEHERMLKQQQYAQAQTQAQAQLLGNRYYNTLTDTYATGTAQVTRSTVEDTNLSTIATTYNKLKARLGK